MSEAEARELELRLHINPSLEREVVAEKESRSSMQVTIMALQTKKAELKQQLDSLQQGSKRDIADRAEMLHIDPSGIVVAE